MRQRPVAMAVGLAGILLGPGPMACGGLSGGGAQSGGGGSSLGIPGLDPDELTSRERGDWAAFVAELPAPCPTVERTLEQCVKERSACAACVPAVRFLFAQVRRGKPPSQVAAAYDLRFAPKAVRRVELGDSPAKGAANPVVVIVEWADFECPACAATASLLDRKVKAYPEHVRLVFKHYPILRHTSSEPAARAAVAAARQGRFWRMHDLMYINSDQLDDDGLLRIAREAGLDSARFREDWSSQATRDQVEADRLQGDALGLRGTPMIFINGRYFDYDIFSVLEDLDGWIQLEIEIATGEQVAPLQLTGSTWPDSESSDAALVGGAAP